MPRPLESLCKDLSSQIIKGEFPHKFVNLNTLNYKGIWPSAEYYYKEKTQENSSVFDLKASCIEYLERDCRSLHEILIKFQSLIYKLVNIDPLTHSTIASISNRAWRILDKDSIKDLYNIPYNKEIFKHFKEAYHGGLCEVYKPYINKGSYLDVNSQYSTAMYLSNFPIGKPQYIESNNLDDYYGVCFAKIDTCNSDNTERGYFTI